MKIVGRRFWTWMSVWALSFLVKGDMFAAHQEKPKVTEGGTGTPHNVPLLKTQSGYKNQGWDKKNSLKTNQFKTRSNKVIDKTSGKGLHDSPTESLKTQSKSKPRGHKGGK